MDSWDYILSAAVSVYYIFDTRPLCIKNGTHLIEYVNYTLPVISVRAANAYIKLRLLSNQKCYILVIA